MLFFFLFFTAAGQASEPVAYVVSADIVATTETPGFAYPREPDHIPYMEGLKEALIYGNIVNVVPLTKGEYAGKWGEAFDAGNNSLGYVDMGALAPMPMYDAFPPEPFRFTTDSPDLFILPGSLPIVVYTLPEAVPYHVVAGEVTDGIGIYKDGGGTEWTLLAFETSRYSGVGLRYAWIRSKDVVRLSARRPDYTKVDPNLVPRNIRDFGRLEDRFYDRILQSGFAMDATPILHDTLRVDDLVESYPDSTFQAIYVPNFVTTDVFLHAFHLVFSRGLKNIEEINFAPGLDRMLKNSLTKLNVLEKKSGKDTFVRDTFARARDFLTVPAVLLSPDAKLKPSTRAKGEIDRILKAEGMEKSPLSGRKEDYTFYRPRGHYTGSETLSRYYRAMAYLGGMSVPLKGDNPEENKSNTALIALLCLLFEDKNLYGEWSALYEPLKYLIGEADDPSVADFAAIVKKALNDNPAKLSDAEKMAALHQELIASTPASRIVDRPSSRPSMTSEEVEAEATGFRIMGRRFVLDAWIFSRLTSPRVGSDRVPRNLPKTEDVMAALGSNLADTLLSGDRQGIPQYADALTKVKNDVREFFKKGSPSVYSDWLETLKLLFADKSSPQFFAKSPLWEAKKLLTASSSWTELKHDTVLYAKQSYAEMGDGGEWEVEPFRNPIPRGYVEPAPQVFNALFNALDRLREIIAKYDLGDRDEESSWHGVRAKVEAFREHVMLFRDIAEKEIKNEPLTPDDYWAISQIPSYLNANLLLDSDIIEDGDFDQLRMALVSDVATNAFAGRVLQVAIGAPRRIYVFVDDSQSGPRVTVGYTYSFYEFARPLSAGRMTDEEWKKLVYDKGRQAELEKLMPEWSRGLFVE